jgi:hypothetical protein
MLNPEVEPEGKDLLELQAVSWNLQEYLLKYRDQRDINLLVP